MNSKKLENWNREADKIQRQRERFIITQEKKKQRQLQKQRDKETAQWTRVSDKESVRREKFMERLQAKATRNRERVEMAKWDEELRQEEQRREKLQDLQDERGWKGSKKFGQVRRRLRRKLEKIQRRLPTFNVVRTYSNANARFTTYFDTYKVYVYGRT